MWISMMGDFGFDMFCYRGGLLGFPHPDDGGPLVSATTSRGVMSMRPAALCVNVFANVEHWRLRCLGPAPRCLMSLSGPSRCWSVWV